MSKSLTNYLKSNLKDIKTLRESDNSLLTIEDFLKDVEFIAPEGFEIDYFILPTSNTEELKTKMDSELSDNLSFPNEIAPKAESTVFVKKDLKDRQVDLNTVSSAASFAVPALNNGDPKLAHTTDDQIFTHGGYIPSISQTFTKDEEPEQTLLLRESTKVFPKGTRVHLKNIKTEKRFKENISNPTVQYLALLTEAFKAYSKRTKALRESQRPLQAILKDIQTFLNTFANSEDYKRINDNLSKVDVSKLNSQTIQYDGAISIIQTAFAALEQEFVRFTTLVRDAEQEIGQKITQPNVLKFFQDVETKFNGLVNPPAESLHICEITHTMGKLKGHIVTVNDVTFSYYYGKTFKAA